MTEAVHIIGGGVCGLAMAAEMSSRGAKVTVTDLQDAPGAHACSWWAGGMLAPDCEGVSAEPDIVRQGRGAANWWDSMGADVTREGTLVIALGRDQSELTTFQRRAPNAQRIDRDALRTLEPFLADQFSTALFLPEEGHLDPRKTLLDLHQRLETQGVAFDHGEANPTDAHVIDCRGFAARDALDDLRGVKGEMLVVHSRDIKLSRPVRLLHPRFPLYIVPRGDGMFMLGATQIESNARQGASLRSVMELMNAAYALHPAFGEAELVEIGVDARPAFPDNQPRVRRMNDKIYANGLFRHGFLLSPALAQMTADLVLEGKEPELWYEDLR